MVLAQQENKSPETVAEWAEWIKRAQADLVDTAVPFEDLRKKGELIKLPKAGSGVPVHREEWIESVARDIGKTAGVLQSVLSGVPPHQPPQPPEKLSPSQSSE